MYDIFFQRLSHFKDTYPEVVRKLESLRDNTLAMQQDNKVYQPLVSIATNKNPQVEHDTCSLATGGGRGGEDEGGGIGWCQRLKLFLTPGPHSN